MDKTREIVQVFNKNCASGYMSIFADTWNWGAMVHSLCKVQRGINMHGRRARGEKIRGCQYSKQRSAKRCHRQLSSEAEKMRRGDRRGWNRRVQIQRGETENRKRLCSQSLKRQTERANGIKSVCFTKMYFLSISCGFRA